MIYVDEIEFHTITKKMGIQWRPINDPEISVDKSYLISDQEFYYLGSKINVVEVHKNRYRIVSTRKISNGPYLNFDVKTTISSQRKKPSKTLLLHRARLIAFVGEDVSKPYARHGILGRENNDLTNLEWGTHQENMLDVQEHGTQKGEHNPQSKITEQLAIGIYVLSHLGLIDSNVLRTLPIGKGTVSGIKTKKKWGHLITGDIEILVRNCREVQEKKIQAAIEKAVSSKKKGNDQAIKLLKNGIKQNIKRILSRV